jgi:hypothetical protein
MFEEPLSDGVALDVYGAEAAPLSAVDVVVGNAIASILNVIISTIAGGFS